MNARNRPTHDALQVRDSLDRPRTDNSTARRLARGHRRAIQLILASPKMLVDEFKLSFQFVGRDLSVTLIPGMVFMLAALNNHPIHDVFRLTVTCAGTFVYFWLYAYVFCLSNQIVGVTEDRINKPDRPLVVGVVTARGALWRLVFVCIGFSLLGGLFGVARWSLLWVALSLVHNFAAGMRYWMARGIIMSLGALVGLAAAWEIVTPLDPIVWKWIVVISALVFLTIPVQDILDFDGDRVTNRRTLPIAIGVDATRIILGFCYLVLPGVVYATLFASLPSTALNISMFIGQSVLSWTVAARLVLRRSKDADHNTYMLCCYWYCAILACAVAAL